MRRFVLACLVTSLASATVQATAATMYITDELTVPLRSGPSNQHRILHAGLPSGTVMETLSTDEAAGYTQIRTSRGTEGWIRTQYLVSEPIAKVMLERTRAELERARTQLASVRNARQELETNLANQTNATTEAGGEIERLEAELDQIRRVSAKAIDTAEENEQLRETNLRLQDELDDLAEAVTHLENNSENQAILIGAGLLFIGLLLGVIIKARPQRSAWS